MDDTRDHAEDPVVTPEPVVAASKALQHSALWLALDQGGHASRALVFDANGKQLAQSFAPISTRREGEDRIEHDAMDVLESLRMVVADICHTLGDDVQRIRAAGLATQRSSVVCWDARNGVPLSPVLSWQDRRNAKLVDSLQTHRDEIQQLTGLVLSPHYGASKLRWCLDELSAVRQALEEQRLQGGPLASFLLHGLLNEHPDVVDPANASRTQLWSPATGTWSAELLKWFDIPREILPRPVATCHRYGSLPMGKHIVPLQVCTGDQAAVPFASGAIQPDAIYLNIGTGAFMLAPLSRDVADAAPLLRSVLFSDSTQNCFALEGTVNGAGSALQWFAERSAIDVDRGLPLLQRKTVEKDIPLFINGIGGVGSPYWLPNIKSEFIHSGVVDEHQMLVAVIESIAFLIADNIALMRAHLPHLKSIVAGGGLSACNYLCECIATLTALPVVRNSEPELTARGLAWLVANQPGQWNQSVGDITHHAEGDESLCQRWRQWKQHIEKLKS